MCGILYPCFKMRIQGNIVDIYKRRIYLGIITIQCGRIAAITPRNASCLDASDHFNPYILPGFIDAHLHLEMTHVIPSEYVRAALSQGTVGAVADCHDSVCVMGVKGALMLINNARKLPFAFGFSAPSTLVPGTYEISDVQRLLSLKEVTHLGEIQNFPDVLLHESYVEELLALAKKKHKPVDGCSPGLSGDRLVEYVSSGISTDHQCTSYENALEKFSYGMAIMVQAKKIDSLTQLLPLFAEHGDRMMFSGQSLYAPHVASKYINAAVSAAVKEGADMFGVLRAACITPVEHYHLDVGTLNVGDPADFIMVDSMERFDVMATFVKGKCYYSNNKAYQAKKVPYRKMYPVNKWNTTAVTEQDLQVSALSQSGKKSASCEIKPQVNVISVCDGEITTVRTLMCVMEKNGLLCSDVAQDCLKVIVYDRYHPHTKPVVGFVNGFGLKTGGAAMSVSHDAHNIVAVGVEDRDIVLAINRVVALKGGIALAVRGKIQQELALPICGLMSNLPLERVNKKFAEMFELFVGEMGCKLLHPIDTLSFIASPQLPSLKLSLKGLVNVVEQEIVPLVP